MLGGCPFWLSRESGGAWEQFSAQLTEIIVYITSQSLSVCPCVNQGTTHNWCVLGLRLLEITDTKPHAENQTHWLL